MNQYFSWNCVKYDEQRKANLLVAHENAYGKLVNEKVIERTITAHSLVIFWLSIF